MTDALHGQLYKRASLPKVAPGPYSATRRRWRPAHTFLGARRRHPRPPRNIRALPRPLCRSRPDRPDDRSPGEIWRDLGRKGSVRRIPPSRERKRKEASRYASSRAIVSGGLACCGIVERSTPRGRPTPTSSDLLPFLRLAPRRHSPRSGREAEEAPSRPSPLRTRAPSFPPTSRTEIRELARRAVTSCMQIACTISVLERARGRSHRTCCARRRRRPHG